MADGEALEPGSLPPSLSTPELSELIETVVMSANDAVLITEGIPMDEADGGPKVLYVNPAFTRMTGYRPEDIVGRTPRVLQSRKTDRAELARLKRLLTWWQPARCELLNVRRDGSEFWVELSVVPVFDPTGDLSHWISVQREITDRKDREAGMASQLQQAQDRWWSAFVDAPIGQAITTPTGRILHANPRLCLLLGRRADDLRRTELADHAHPDDAPVARQICEQLGDQKDVSVRQQLQLTTSAGRPVHVNVSAALARHQDGSPSHVVMHVEDVTAERTLRDALNLQAMHDPLTGLPNRTLLLDRLTQALGGSGSDSTTVSVFFVDLDHFKVINDSLGHAAGDQVVVTVAQRLTKLLRSGDTAARFGGDEFVLICPATTASAAMAIAGRLAEAVAEPVELTGGRATITASIGVVVADGGADAGRLIADADTAMYQAKRAGRGRSVLFTDGLRTRAVARFELESALRSGIDAGQLRLHHQVQVSLRDGALVGREALVRWEHPSQGLLTPGHFLDLAGEAGLIERLDRWVLEEACRSQADSGREDPLWVNLSASDLARPRLPREVATMLDKTGLAPERLGFEVTESGLMESLEGAARVLSGLHDLGVHLAVDDFGTGYSSLAYLQRLPFDLLKIDRSFVTRLGDPRQGPENEAIVTAVIELAHALGRLVVAEGVEGPAQAERLVELGCDIGQGWYLGLPVPIDRAPDRRPLAVGPLEDPRPLQL